MKVVVIIPAAGLGTRMTSAPGAKGKKLGAMTKQFTELGGTPILIHTLRKFVASPEVSEICVALRGNEIEGFRARLEKEAKDILQKKVHLVEGGEHRQHSVANALHSLSANDDDIVLVHDAVRPFVTEEIIRDVIRAAQKYGAAIAGLPAGRYGQAGRAHIGRCFDHGHPPAGACGHGTNPARLSLRCAQEGVRRICSRRICWNG